VVIILWDVTEHGIHASCNGDGNGQHIVNQQRTTRDNASLLSQHVSGNYIAAATMRKVLDDARVSIGDNENGQGG
jgi:hypothetical protein